MLFVFIWAPFAVFWALEHRNCLLYPASAIKAWARHTWLIWVAAAHNDWFRAP